jgi:histidinol phosphatase-like PHP family hydrolase
LATTIVHPLLPFGHTEQYDSAIASLSDTGLLEAFGLAAEQGVALEITPSFLPPTDGKDPGWSLDTPLRVLMLARQAGCRFCFGSDAHTLAGMAGLKKTQIFVDRLSLLEKDMAPIVRR